MGESRPTRGPGDSLVQRDARDTHRLLDRILDTPHIAQVVPRLQPELLHKVIQTCGLEDCGELAALATPEQLARVFDLDLWRSDVSGRDEQFDGDRFGLWLEVLAESGVHLAAEKLAQVDVDLVIAGLAQHTRVFDRAAITPYQTTDGEEVAPVRNLDDRLTCDVGGFLLVARHPESASSWDAIAAVLTALDAEHHDYFHQVMRGCRTLSHAGHEVDGLHDLLGEKDQALFDLGFDRERRRESQGYATPAQARAFLDMSRQLRLDRATDPPANPVARAYFRAIAVTTTADADGPPRQLSAGSDTISPPVDPSTTAAALGDVLEMLRDAGIVGQEPRLLLAGSTDRTPRLARIQAHMQGVLDSDFEAYSKRNDELAYLANTLAAGCSIQARPFTAQEAWDAAVAVCNLGLENRPHHWGQEIARVDLVSVFQVGWTVLHDDVCMYAAGQLIDVLAGLRFADRDLQAGVDDLRAEMARHCRAGAPWRARDALEVIAILDMPAWATLLALIDECPVIHAGLAASRRSGTYAVPASAFEFISENSQVALVRDFMESLPDALGQ